MNVPLVAAGSLAVLGAAIHGVGGEVLVVRKLSPAMLPSSRFGGPRVTKTMIHATWHMTTIAFLSVGSALLLQARSSTATRRRASAWWPPARRPASPRWRRGRSSSPRSLLRHPAPILLTATAALAWWGAL